MNILDLTRTYENGQIAGNPKRHPIVILERMGKIEKDGLNTSKIILGSHTGTHMDAPRHFIVDGETIDNLDLSRCVGDVVLIDFRRFEPGDVVKLEDVESLRLGERMLFAFGWERFADDVQKKNKWPYFSLEAAEYLADNGVRLIATDLPSPDACPTCSPTDFEVHRSLLRKDVTFVESLVNIEQIDFNKTYALIALPLKARGLDGAPCRVVLVKLG